jgi:cation/acetate symporter
MLSGGRGDGRAIGQAYAVYAVAFVVFATVVAVLAELGVVERLVALLVIGVPLVSFAAIGIVSGTLSEGDFLVAGRQVPAVFNGFSGAVAVAGLTGLMGPAAIFLADPATGAAVVLGTATGLAFLAILVAPYFRKSGAVTVAEFLAIRYGGRLTRLSGIAVLVAVAFPALVAAFGAAGWVGAEVFGIPANAAVTVAVACTLLAALFGGVRGVTLVAGAQGVVFLLALLVPPTLAALQDGGFPLPQLTYGYTLDEANSFEGKVTLLAGHLFPIGAGSGMVLATFLTLAAAFAVLPQLLLRTSTSRGVSNARRSAGWTLFFTLPALFTAPAVAAYVKLAVFNDVIGSSADDLPDWIFDYGRHGLVKLCGVDAASLAAVKAACMPLLGADGVIGSAALALDPDVVGLGFAGIVDLPYVVTALIAAGAIAASLAAAGALLGSVANAFGHDLYGKIANRRATAGRRLIVTRLLYLILAALAGWFAVRRPDASFTLAAGMPALAAGGLFPAVFLGIWWRRATRLGALAGIAAGVVGVVGHFLIARHGGSGIVLGFGSSGVPALAAGIYGLVPGFAVTIAVSLATPVPDDERQAVIDAIRRPRRDALLEDGGA